MPSGRSKYIVSLALEKSAKRPPPKKQHFSNVESPCYAPISPWFEDIVVNNTYANQDSPGNDMQLRNELAEPCSTDISAKDFYGRSAIKDLGISSSSGKAVTYDQNFGTQDLPGSLLNTCDGFRTQDVHGPQLDAYDDSPRSKEEIPGTNNETPTPALPLDFGSNTFNDLQIQNSNGISVPEETINLQADSGLFNKDISVSGSLDGEVEEMTLDTVVKYIHNVTSTPITLRSNRLVNYDSSTTEFSPDSNRKSETSELFENNRNSQVSCRKTLFQDHSGEQPVSREENEQDCIEIEVGLFQLEKYFQGGENTFTLEVADINSGPLSQNSASQSSLQNATLSGDSFESSISPNSSECKRSRKYTPPDKHTRKRAVHSQKWLANISKTAYNRGEEHLNLKGKLIKGRSIQIPCNLSCRLKCSLKFSHSEREAIFNQFWKKQGSKTSKWEFIARYVKLTDKKTNKKNVTRRKHSREYFFSQKGVNKKVCKTFFLSTLDICDSWIDTCMKRVEKGGVISPDKRGKHVKCRSNAIPEVIKQTVADHLNLIPKMESHYVRANSLKTYLTEDIKTITKLHELYIDWMEEYHPGEKPATKRQYTDIFNNDFNIGFFSFKKDQCDECTEYNNSNEEEQLKLKERYESHILNKDLAKNMKEADKKVAQLKDNRTLCVACFDYEKILNSPQANLKILYYKRKLAVNNFTVADVGCHDGYCYVYDETIAKKGSNEVASFLLHFFEKQVAAGFQEFRLYSDNCMGQNKNQFVASLYCYAAAKFNISIKHRFLEKGHTYNDADNIHSLIERNTKPYQIYTPNEWYQHIRTAKRSKTKPLIVIEVDQSMIFDVKNLAEKQNFKKNSSGEAVKWSKIREVSVDSSNPYELKYKLTLNGEEHKIYTKKVGRPVNLLTHQLKLAYDGPLPISAAKLKDLLDLCQNNYIPKNYQSFYQSLVPESAESAAPHKNRNLASRKRQRNESDSEATSDYD